MKITFITFVIFCLVGCAFFHEKRSIELAKIYSDKIDAFIKINGCSPNTLEMIGVKTSMEGPVYYEKKGNENYIIWVGGRLGESYFYDSSKKQWTNGSSR